MSARQETSGAQRNQNGNWPRKSRVCSLSARLGTTTRSGSSSSPIGSSFLFLQRKAAPIRYDLSGRFCFSNQRRSEEHTSELQSLTNLVCRLLLEKKKTERHKIPL